MTFHRIVSLPLAWFLLFVGPLNTPIVGGMSETEKERNQPSQNGEHEIHTLCGWKVHVSRELLKEDAELTAQAIELLQMQLSIIQRVVPEAAVQQLQKVPLFVSPEYDGFGPKAEYHPSAEWLREHGRDPAMAQSVEFTNVRIFESECRRMPLFVLHELAHAYHDRVLGNEHAGILAAYQNAKASGTYQRVQRRDAEGRLTLDRAYALSNPQEYFAECTEAYFGTNDFFPFNREQLAKHDPDMCQLLAKLWGVDGGH